MDYPLRPVDTPTAVALAAVVVEGVPSTITAARCGLTCCGGGYPPQPQQLGVALPAVEGGILHNHSSCGPTAVEGVSTGPSAVFFSFPPPPAVEGGKKIGNRFFLPLCMCRHTSVYMSAY